MPNDLIEAVPEKHSMEKLLVGCMEPLIDDMVKSEKRIDKLDTALDAIRARIDVLADDVETKTGTALKTATAETISEIRSDFESTIKAVQNLLDEQLAVITRQSRELKAQTEIKEMAAVHFITNEAHLWGA